MVKRNTFLPSSLQCPLSALYLLVKVCRRKSTSPPSVRATVQLPLRCSCPPSPPLLRCMCWLSSLPPPPLSADLLLWWPGEWFAPQLPAVTICPFNVWSADAHSLLSFPLSLSLSLFGCLSSCFNHLLLSLLLVFLSS